MWFSFGQGKSAPAVYANVASGVLLTFVVGSTPRTTPLAKLPSAPWSAALIEFNCATIKLTSEQRRSNALPVIEIEKLNTAITRLEDRARPVSLTAGVASGRALQISVPQFQVAVAECRQRVAGL
jgi:hypothetical protein